jgi:hypothetical protein
LPIQVSFPIFLGGLMRWVVDKINPPRPEESDSSSGVLLCSGYIAGGSLVGVLAAFLNFREDWVKSLNLSERFNELLGSIADWAQTTPELKEALHRRLIEFWEPGGTLAAFGLMYLLLFVVGIWGFRSRKAGKTKELGSGK